MFYIYTSTIKNINKGKKMFSGLNLQMPEKGIWFKT